MENDLLKARHPDFKGDWQDLNAFIKLVETPLRSEERGRALTEWSAWNTVMPKIESPDGILLKIHAQGNPKGVDLRGGDFQNICVGRSDLRSAKFDESQLQYAMFKRANLYGASFKNAKAQDSLFLKADAVSADFGEAKLQNSRCMEADFRHANFAGADLRGADLSTSNLSHANLSGACLENANLSQAIMVGTNVEGAVFSGATVYGAAVWDLQGKPADQRDLQITPQSDAEITADNLNIAQFLYLVLENKNFKGVIDTITSRMVLILGRFTPPRKAVLDALRETLRTKDFVPVVFDFDKPASRNITETVGLLARMARFVIADLTDAKSIPQELQSIVPQMPSVPVQPIILDAQHEYSMFVDLRDYNSVLVPYRYPSQDDLLASLDSKVIAPVQIKLDEIEARRRAFEAGH